MLNCRRLRLLRAKSENKRCKQITKYRSSTTQNENVSELLLAPRPKSQPNQNKSFAAPLSAQIGARTHIWGSNLYG